MMRFIRRLKDSRPNTLIDDRDLKLEGLDYVASLRVFHEVLAPQSYVEIGTATGHSLVEAACRSIAIDPQFQISRDVIGQKPELRLLQMTSEQAFSSGAIGQSFPDGVDFAFIDGLHLVEAVLDDFIGMERHSHATSVVAFHDVLPSNVRVGERERSILDLPTLTAGWWTGDVWKLVPILLKWRPDLRVTVLDSASTGLLLVSGLDAGNETLSRHRAVILEEWQTISLAAYTLERLVGEVDIKPAPDADALKATIRAHVSRNG